MTLMALVLGGVVLIVLVGMFIVVYVFNQQTQKPQEHVDQTTDTKGCFNINRDSKDKD